MLSSQALVLSLLALSVALSAGFVTVPVERVQVSSGPASLRRYLLDPVNAVPGAYVALLNIGGQNYRVLVDTGSFDTYLSASGCTITSSDGPSTGCHFTTNYYNGSGAVKAYDSTQCAESVTFGGASNRCQVSLRYADNDFITGIARTDSLLMGSYNISTVFGAATSMTESFLIPGLDGVWGMQRPNTQFISLRHGPLAALFDAGLPRLFSLCLTANAGELHLGGFDTTYAGSATQWIKFSASQAKYSIQVSFLSAEGRGTTLVSHPGGFAYLDSGSTFTYFPTAVYNDVVSYIRTTCTSCPDVFGTTFVAADPAAFPTITIVFNDVNGAEASYRFAGKDYLIQDPIISGRYLAGFQAYDGAYIIGQSFLKNWYTIFDIRYGVIGLAPLQSGKCTAPSAAPIAPFATITPSTVKPPTSTGGIIAEPNSDLPLPPIIDTSTPFPADGPEFVEEPIAVPMAEVPSSGPGSPVEPSSAPGASGPIASPAIEPSTIIIPNTPVSATPNAPNTPSGDVPTPSSSSPLTLSINCIFALIALMLIFN